MSFQTVVVSVMPLAGRSFELCDQNLKIAPASAGVYALYQNHELIYVGHAQGDLTTIRSCLQDHKAGRLGPGTKAADTYKRETCGDPLALERKLLEEFKRTYGKLPRCNQALADPGAKLA